MSVMSYYKHTAYLHEFMTAVTPLNHQTNGRESKKQSVLIYM